MMLNKILIHWFTFNVTTRFQLIQPAAIQLVIRPYILLPIDIFNFFKYTPFSYWHRLALNLLLPQTSLHQSYKLGIKENLYFI